MVVLVFVLLLLKDSIVDAFISTDLEVRINRICNDEEDGCDAGYVEDSFGDVSSGDGAICSDRSAEGSRYDKAEST